MCGRTMTGLNAIVAEFRDLQIWMEILCHLRACQPSHAQI